MTSKPPFGGEVVSFSEAFAEVSRGVRKVKQKDYLLTGAHPIVDQGQELIAGYSNEGEGLFEDVPALVFGDHTRCVKYVDEPFFAGADGVKILKPKLSDNVHYWYHALRNTPLGNLGYSRHFKLLKQASFVNRDAAEQAAIVERLDAIEGLQDTVDRQLAALDSLVKSRFVEMFGDPKTNSCGWPVKQLGQISDTRLGKMLDKKKQTGSHLFPYLANTNVQWFRFELGNLNQMDFDESDQSEFELRDGDVLATEGGEVGRSAIWHNQLEHCYFQKAVHRIRCHKDCLLPEYLVWAFKMKSELGLFYPYTSKSTIAHLTGKKIKQVPLQLPPLALQREFADFATRVDKLRVDAQAQKDKLQTLYDSLAQDYFAV